MSSDAFRLRLLESAVIVLETELPLPLEIGRRDSGDGELHSLTPAAPGRPARLVIAPADETRNVSRRHALLEAQPDGLLRVSNRSQIDLPLTDGQSIPAGRSLDLRPPAGLLLPPRTVFVLPPAGSDEGFTLSGQTVAPGSPSRLLAPMPAVEPRQLDSLLRWLQSAVGVLQSTVGSTDFLRRAALALIDILGLDSGRVLLRRGDAWDVVAASGVLLPDWKPSRRVLQRLLAEKRTYFHPTLPSGSDSDGSMRDLVSVVAAPLLDAAGQVIGALYAERRSDSPGSLHGGGKVEALLVEVLATAVATGLARQEQEREALQARVRFEQFFTPELARQLEKQPDLVESGRTMPQVSVLFCDVRGYSGFSERLKEGSIDWIHDVMNELSECVRAEGGVLVDYIGDELMAMWGAPEEQPDQAQRCARAALAILGRLDVLNGRWQERLGKPMDLGIGVNSGPAHVGNTGSKFKFKYGPLGNTVNLASRVQGLTKYLKCRLLVTESTRLLLDEQFAARRVVRTRVVNIAEPVDVFEVAANEPGCCAFFGRSEEALELLEEGQFTESAHLCGRLLAERPGDGPLILTLSRATEMLVKNGVGFHPVWEPPGK